MSLMMKKRKKAGKREMVKLRILLVELLMIGRNRKEGLKMMYKAVTTNVVYVRKHTYHTLHYTLI